MITKAFWVAALERAGKSGAQALITLASIGGVFNLAAITWRTTGVGVLSMMVLSLLMSVLSAGVGPAGSPSLVADPEAASVPDAAAAERLADVPPPQKLPRADSGPPA